MTALNYHLVPVMPLSQRWKEEVDVTEKEREEVVETNTIDLTFYSCFFFFFWAPVVCKGRLCGCKIFQRREYTACGMLDMFIEETLPCLEKGHFYFCMFYSEKLHTAQSHLKSPEEQLSSVVLIFTISYAVWPTLWPVSVNQWLRTLGSKRKYSLHLISTLNLFTFITLHVVLDYMFTVALLLLPGVVIEEGFNLHWVLQGGGSGRLESVCVCVGVWMGSLVSERKG